MTAWEHIANAKPRKIARAQLNDGELNNASSRARIEALVDPSRPVALYRSGRSRKSLGDQESLFAAFVATEKSLYQESGLLASPYGTAGSCENP